MRGQGGLASAAAVFALVLLPALFARAQVPFRVIYPEQRRVEYRDPGQFPPADLPPTAPPPTVAQPPAGGQRLFALDDAVRTSLGNTTVVRVLAGVSAVNSGRTIYDAALTNTAVDQALGRFDPTIQINNNWDYIDLPSVVFLDPLNPLLGSTIVGAAQNPLNRYRMNMAVTKDNPLGGQWQLGVNVTEQQFPGSLFPLNPATNSNAALSYTQPLLQGFGPRANLAPVVLARVNTEISFFQLKNATQQNVRDVIASYWNLVAARAAEWARARQVDQAAFAFELADANFRFQRTNAGDRAQARTSLAQFRAQLIGARATVLQQEGTLRNLLGLPPWDDAQLIPTTEPVLERVRPDWRELVELAAARRPDLVELKLVLEADEQQRIIANNNALPALDSVALYRWNGLEGELPAGNRLSSAPGQFTDWTLGVNFSVPVGLRQARAQLRQRELIIARDRANLDQALHAASHLLATALRGLDQAYEQYQAFKEAREAARENLDVQIKSFQASIVNYLPVLVAITDWGNAITNEATAIAQYNTLLADLETLTGTILETHGIRFYEERYGSISPLGRLACPASYPEATPPTPNDNRYPAGGKAAENVFNLEDPAKFLETKPLPMEALPPLPPVPVPNSLPLPPPGVETLPPLPPLPPATPQPGQR